MQAGHDNKQLDALVQRLYDAALDARLWQGIAADIAGVFDSSSTVLKAQAADGRVRLMDTTDNLLVAPAEQAWADHWHANDVWVQRSVAFGMSRVVTNADLIDDREFERSDFYGDWCRRLEIYHMLGAVFPLDDNAIGVLGIHRQHGAGHFPAASRRQAAAFLPHLQRALLIRQRLADAALARTTLFEALQRLAVGVLVVDRAARVLFANSQAERIVRSNAPLVDIRGGRLQLGDAQLALRLQRAIRDAVSTAAGIATRCCGAMALQRAAGLPLTLLVSPLRGADLAEPAALLFLRDGRQAALQPALLREMFGLTRTEAALAAEMARGCALDAIASKFGIGIGTARSHLKSVLAKTGTRRQGELIALIGGSVAGLVDDAGESSGH